jgi:hypothetical protein
MSVRKEEEAKNQKAKIGIADIATVSLTDRLVHCKK